MSFSLREFDEDTSSELFVLSLLGSRRIRVPGPERVYHLEDNPRGGRSRSALVGIGAAGASPAAMSAYRGLDAIAFLTAFKVLDLLVEHVLRANDGPTARPGFKTKIKWLQQNTARSLPTPLDVRRGVWDRLVVLFCELADSVRGGIAHRRVQVVDDEIVVYDAGHPRQELKRLSAGQIAAFNAAIQTVAALIIEQSVDERRVGLLEGYLNELQPLHNCQPLPATIDPNADVWLLIVDLQPLRDGVWQFDVAEARSVIENQGPGDVWNLELRAGDRIVFARWEQVPEGDGHDIDVAEPPLWVEQQLG